MFSVGRSALVIFFIAVNVPCPFWVHKNLPSAYFNPCISLIGRRKIRKFANWSQAKNAKFCNLARKIIAKFFYCSWENIVKYLCESRWKKISKYLQSEARKNREFAVSTCDRLTKLCRSVMENIKKFVEFVSWLWEKIRKFLSRSKEKNMKFVHDRVENPPLISSEKKIFCIFY